MLVSLNSDGRQHYVPKPIWSMVYWEGSNPVWYFPSYGNRTHVNSLEGCCVTTTPMMLLKSDMDGWEQQAPKLLCNKYLWKISVNVIGSASYENRTHAKSLKSYYATTSSTMLGNSYVKEGEPRDWQRICMKWWWQKFTHPYVFASYGNWTLFNTLEGYYSTTTPTLLVDSDLNCWKQFGFKPFWSKVFLKFSHQTWSSASCWT